MPVLFSSQLLAERVYLKNGKFVDGSIIQQSRTAVRIRSVDGRTVTLKKDAIRRIDYSYDPQKEAEKLRRKRLLAEQERQRREAQKRAEEEQRSKLEEQERQRLEAEKKAEEERRKKLEEQERQRLEAEKKAEEERRKALLQKIRKRSPRPETSSWWIEPAISAGKGSFQSVLRTFYWDTIQNFPLILGLATGLYPDGAPAEINAETEWDYGQPDHFSAGLRAGKGNIWVELDVRSVRVESPSPFAESPRFTEIGVGRITGSPGDITSLKYRLRMVTIQKLNEDHNALRTGYRFFNSNRFSASGILGVHQLKANMSYYGPNNITGVTDPYNSGSNSFGSELSMVGGGPEIGLELEKRLEIIPLVLRASIALFHMHLNASLQDVQFYRSWPPDDYTAIFQVESQYRNSGGSLTLHAGYQFSTGTEFFLEWYGLRSNTVMTKVNHRFSTVENPAQTALATIMAPERDRYQANAEKAEIVSIGISQRFTL